jgi:hypothetical protein
MVLAGDVMALYMPRNFRMNEMRPVLDHSLCGTNASHAIWSLSCISSTNWQQLEFINLLKQNQDFVSYLRYECILAFRRSFISLY